MRVMLVEVAELTPRWQTTVTGAADALRRNTSAQFMVQFAEIAGFAVCNGDAASGDRGGDFRHPVATCTARRR